MRGSHDLSALLRRGAVAVSAGRVALGVVALAWPAVPARPWVAAGADDLTVRVLGRALGARDVALGLGALIALCTRSGHGGEAGAGRGGQASTWLAAGALCDSLDVAATASAWRDLPRAGRWLVAACAGGAALAGLAGALAAHGAGA